MNKKENNIIYTAQDIQNYLEGKLTPKEMFEIEKAALDDEFLAEAIEGYETVPTEKWVATVGNLKENFSNISNKTKVVSINYNKTNWWRIVAAAVVIGIIITTLFLVNSKKEKSQIAANVQLEKDTITNTETVSAEKPEVESKNYDLAVEESQKITRSHTPKVVAAPVEANKADDGFIYTPNIKSQQTLKEFESRVEEATAEVAPTVAAVPQAGNNAAELNKRMASTTREKQQLDNDQLNEINIQQQRSRNFLAQVVGPDNIPLPFANVSIKTEDFGTYADINGNFRLISADSVLTVEVKSLGYKPKNYTLQSNVQQNKLILLEDNSTVKENVVIGYGNKAKSKPVAKLEVITDTSFNAEPTVGWNNYTTYFNNNIQIPEEIEKNNLHGQVELSFDVTPSGKITNIKIDKSLCENCDEAAIQTIQNGPHWKSKKGKKSKGKVIVAF